MEQTELLRCVNDIEHIYAQRLENTTESDPCSYKATKAVVKSDQKKFRGFHGIRTYDICDSSMKPAASRSRVSSVYTHHTKRMRYVIYDKSYIFTVDREYW